MADGFITNESGNIKISEEVVVRISAISAREVEGVAMLGTPAASLSDLLGKKNQSKGVKAELKENAAEIDIHISVRFGYRISDVARKVQESVKFALESYVGINNILVNVFVDAIDVEKTDADKIVFDEPEETEDVSKQETSSEE